MQRFAQIQNCTIRANKATSRTESFISIPKPLPIVIRAILAPRGSRGLRSCGSYLERIRGPVIQAAGGAPGTGIPDCSGGTGRLLPNDCGREKRIGPTDIEERTQEPGTRPKDRNVYE